MRGSLIPVLIAELESVYRQASPRPLPALNDPEILNVAEHPRRRRVRRSDLEAYRSIVEAFIHRRARARNPSVYTYRRLAQLLKRKSGRSFAVSTLQRRLIKWGLVDGMRRYNK